MSVRMAYDVMRMRDIATHCPLCGREAAKAPHTDEHIFPLWLQHHLGLINQKLTIPNLIDKRYKSVKIGICARCNNETFGALEKRMAAALTAEDAIARLVAMDPGDVALWLAKIFWLLARKSNSAQDHRTRHLKRPTRILGDEAMSMLWHVGMFLRCFAVRKAMFACYADDPPIPQIFYNVPYSLYLVGIDTRDPREGSFHYIDSALMNGAALRCGGAAMICLFDGGIHRDFRSPAYDFLRGNRLHPTQFDEVVARFFYDQTLVAPSDWNVTYHWNKHLNAIVAQRPTRRWECPYHWDERYDGAALAHMLGYVTKRDPSTLLFEGGRIPTSLRGLDGSFLPYPVTQAEIEAYRREPGYVRLGPPDPEISRRLSHEAWLADIAAKMESEGG